MLHPLEKHGNAEQIVVVQVGFSVMSVFAFNLLADVPITNLSFGCVFVAGSSRSPRSAGSCWSPGHCCKWLLQSQPQPCITQLILTSLNCLLLTQEYISKHHEQFCPCPLTCSYLLQTSLHGCSCMADLQQGNNLTKSLKIKPCKQ